jgi:hypothetical protein
VGLGSQVAELRDKALELAGRPRALPALEGPVSRDDGWGLAVLGWLGVVEDWPAGAAALLAHCATARTGRTGPRWDKTCRQRLDAVAGPSGLLRRLLDLVVSAAPALRSSTSGHQSGDPRVTSSQLAARPRAYLPGVLGFPAVALWSCR